MKENKLNPKFYKNRILFISYIINFATFIICFILSILVNNSNLATASIIFLLSTYVLYLSWVYRSFANLQAFGFYNLYPSSPGKAIIYHLLPFANIIFPFIVMLKTWECSDPTILKNDIELTNKAKHSYIVFIWWMCFIFLSIAFKAVAGLQDAQANSILLGILFLFFMDFVLLFTIMHLITKRQDEKASKLELI